MQGCVSDIAYPVVPSITLSLSRARQVIPHLTISQFTHSWLPPPLSASLEVLTDRRLKHEPVCTLLLSILTPCLYSLSLSLSAL